MTKKIFNSDDTTTKNKLKSFISTYTDLQSYGIDNEELLDGVLEGFLESFPTLADIPAPPAVPAFAIPTARYGSGTTNLHEIPLPSLPNDARPAQHRRILGYVILNKTTGAISGHFHGQIFLSHLKADSVLTEFLINEQNILMFNVGSAKKNYEIVPVSANPTA